MKIICIESNYYSYIEENKIEKPTNPIFFLKPDSALLLNNRPFFIPEIGDIYYETEIVIRISKVGKYIREEFAENYIEAIGIGVDFTAKELLIKLRNEGLPWEAAKCFDGAAPISKLLPYSDFKTKDCIEFTLSINDKIVQYGNTKDMIFNFKQIISYISKFMTLKKGDLIFTGTPAGCEKVFLNDNLKAYIFDELMLNFNVK